jgi:putative ABC transport system permease protein
MGCAAALVGAVGAGAWALSLPLPAAPVDAAEGAPPLMTLLLLVTLACAGTALALAVRAIPNLAARAAGRLPLAPRLAFRDAADHRSRFLPAVAAVLVSVGVASYAAVLAGSGAANDANQRGQLVAPGHLAVGPQVQVSDAFDRMVLLDALQGVAQEVPVTGTEPFYMVRFDAPEAQAGGAEATEEGNESGAGAEGRGESNGVQDARRSAAQGEEEVYGDHFRPVQPADRTCPEGLYPDTGSGIEVGAPLNCVGYDQAFHPSLMTAGLTNGEVYALTGDALRASGLDGAEAAAQVLDAGGVVVRNAAQLSGNGTVRLAIAADPLPDEQNADRFVELPGAFLRGFTPVAAVSPETARDLGFPGLRYIGEYLVTSRPLSHAEVALAKRLIQERSPLAAVATRYLPYPWGDSWALAPIVLLAALAVAATAISLALAKTQSRRDMATMHAVGATGAFLRRFTAAQAGAVLAAGAPLGVAAGIALGAYQVAWNRRTGVGGAWLDTVPLWGLQGGIVLGVVAAAAVATVLLGRPPLRLTRRRID